MQAGVFRRKTLLGFKLALLLDFGKGSEGDFAGVTVVDDWLRIVTPELDSPIGEC
jgi:hypothetical protein